MSGGMQLAFIERTVALVMAVLAVMAAFRLARAARYVFEIGGALPFGADASFAQFVPATVVTMVVTPIVFATRGIHRIDRNEALLESVGAVIGGFTTAFAAVVMFAFFFRFEPSRIDFLFAWIIGIALMFGHRWLQHSLRRARRGRGDRHDRADVACDGPRASKRR